MNLHEAIEKAMHQLNTTNAKMVVIGPIEEEPLKPKSRLIEDIPFGELHKDSQNHLFQEYISGKTILYRAAKSSVWQVCEKPIWSEDCFYKVKEYRSYTEVQHEVQSLQAQKLETEEHLEDIKLKLQNAVDELRELDEDIPF